MKVREVEHLVTVISEIEKYVAFARQINADKDYSQPLLDSDLIEEKLDRARMIECLQSLKTGI